MSPSIFFNKSKLSAHSRSALTNAEKINEKRCFQGKFCYL